MRLAEGFERRKPDGPLGHLFKWPHPPGPGVVTGGSLASVPRGPTGIGGGALVGLPRQIRVAVTIGDVSCCDLLPVLGSLFETNVTCSFETTIASNR